MQTSIYTRDNIGKYYNIIMGKYALAVTYVLTYKQFERLCDRNDRTR